MEILFNDVYVFVATHKKDAKYGLGLLTVRHIFYISDLGQSLI